MRNLVNANIMKGFFRSTLLLVAAALSVVSCSKDGERGRLSFEKSALFFMAGETKSVKFSASDVRSLTVSSKPAEWGDPVINTETKTVRITAPAPNTEGAAESGTLTITGRGDNGRSVSASIYVSISRTVDMSDRPANSYLVNSRQTNYLFDAMHAGDGTTALETARLQIIWQRPSDLIEYLTLDEEGRASFFVGADDDDEGRIKQGNALIGAYDTKGNLLWSWHVWAADYDPDNRGTVSFNGYEMMDRNLGALADSNASSDDVLNSFGLYYQWGRKEPFIGPGTYDFSNGTSATLYDDEGDVVSLSVEESSAETGTVDYAREHPLTFIAGVEASEYDWMWGSHSEALWSDEKTVNDPCPYGWKVAPAAAFAGLTIADPLEGVSADEYFDKYGWTLTDGSAESLFMGAGRRIYPDGRFQNIYVNPDSERQVRNVAMYDQPWVGLYWTTDISSSQSSSFYFFFNKLHVENSRVEGPVLHYRANGMPVRCVADR